jgi:hypothetical protein
MDRRSFMTGIAATVATAFSGPALAALPLWQLLGTKTVSFLVDRDTLFVGRQQGAFRRIRLRVRGGGLEVFDLRIFFANGSSQDVSVRRYIPPGGQTRVIDLNGGSRFIDRIRIIYRRPTIFVQTRVEFWGGR